MALSQSNVVAIFKQIGKLIKIDQVATSSALTLKTLAMASIRQGVTGEASEFDQFNDVLVTVNANCKTAMTAVEKLPGQMKDLVTKYLTDIVAVQAGVTAEMTPVLDAIRTAMLANSQHLEPGGVFATYFADQLGYNELPTTLGSDTIPDSWITDQVV